MRFLLFCSYSLAAILAIDYGSSYSKLVLLSPNNNEIVLSSLGKRKDSAAIYIDGDNSRIYGDDTFSACNRFPSRCVRDIKKLVQSGAGAAGGGDYVVSGENGDSSNSEVGGEFPGDSIDSEVRGGENEFSGEFPGKNGDSVDSEFSGEFSSEKSSENSDSISSFLPSELFAMSLLDIKKRALSLYHIIDDVAITVAPFANFETKQTYLDSLKLAKFSNILGLVDEGTAVALNFVINKKLNPLQKEFFLIYDIGAGTTTATLFSFFNNTLEIESIGYEPIGGNSLTDEVYTVFEQEFINKFSIKPSSKIQNRLYQAAEKAKLILSANYDFSTTLESLYDDIDFKVSISRSNFEELSNHLEKNLLSPIYSAVEKSTISLNDISSVILNGGSTRVPFIQSFLKSLIGEDRISKSVNTDESAAFGTSYRALQLKSTLQKPSDIKVIEKSNFDYKIKVDDNEISAFPLGSIPEVKKIDLTNFVSDSFKISLFENDRNYKIYQFDDLSKKSEKLSCKSKQMKSIIGHFELDVNKMFDLVKVEVQCESEEEVDVPKNETLFEKHQRVTNIPLPKPEYPTMNPLIGARFEKSKNLLIELDSKDEQRLNLNNVRNKLESLCYDIRNFIDDHQTDLIEDFTSEKDLDKLVSEVSETIEWLEFDSDDAKFEEIEDKYSKLKEKKDELNSFEEMKGADLTLEGFRKLQNDGTTIHEKIIERIDQFKDEIEEFKPKFENEKFDYKKELDRIETYIKSTNQGKDPVRIVQKLIKQYKVDLDNLTKFLKKNEKKWTSLSKKSIFHHYQQISKGMIQILTDLVAMEQGHPEKIKLLESKLKQLVKRKAKQEERAKLKQKKGGKETEDTEEADVVEEQAEPESVPEHEPEAEIEDEKVSVEEPEPVPTPELEHDEL